MCVVALENFARVMLCGRRHIAALGVEDDRDRRMAVANVGDQALQRVFGRRRCEVGDLRLECADEIGGCIDDRLAELEDRIIAGCADARESARGRDRARRTAACRQVLQRAFSISTNFIGFLLADGAYVRPKFTEGQASGSAVNGRCCVQRAGFRNNSTRSGVGGCVDRYVGQSLFGAPRFS